MTWPDTGFSGFSEHSKSHENF